jgi:hypothetical protein
MKRLEDLSISPGASCFLIIFAPVFCLLVCSRRFPPIRSPFYVKLSWGLNYPSPFGLEELHANGKAFALQWLAVSHSAFGTKLTRARSEHQWFTWFPAAHTDDARATRADVLGKSRFRAGRPAMAVNEDGDFHRDALFGSIRHEFFRMRHLLVHAHRQAAMRVRFCTVLLPGCFMA